LHCGIAEATGNEYLLATVTTVIRLHFWAGNTVMGDDGGTPGSPIASARQHLAIAQAIRNGDPDMAAREMQQHIQTSLESYELEVCRRMNDGHFQR
jgi:GntR family transcriptional repressor for pyruvate dehydrogenase complex